VPSTASGWYYVPIHVQGLRALRQAFEVTRVGRGHGLGSLRTC
jgi:hypothetical protein